MRTVLEGNRDLSLFQQYEDDAEPLDADSLSVSWRAASSTQQLFSGNVSVSQVSCLLYVFIFL